MIGFVYSKNALEHGRLPTLFRHLDDIRRGARTYRSIVRVCYSDARKTLEYYPDGGEAF
jgi:hypothetical protein